MDMRLRNSGFSLIELMISITIGLLIVAGVTMLIARTSASRGELEKANRQIENGRYAYEVIAHDLRHAGYYGLIPAAKTPSTTAPDVCATAATTIANSLSFAVQGISNYGSGNPEAVRAAIFSCLPAGAIVPGTDVLAIRRVATEVTATADLDSATLYVQTGLVPDGSGSGKQRSQLNVGLPSAPFPAKVKDAGTGSTGANVPVYTTPAPLRRYIVRIYFISPCSEPVLTCPTGSTQLPTLKRIELGAGTFPAKDSAGKDIVEVIAEGIEDLQVDYGVNCYTNGTYLDGSANSYVPYVPVPYSLTSPACADSWQDVVSTKIYLLARNIDKSLDYKDKRQYQLGLKDDGTPDIRPPKDDTASDNYKRHVYSGLVRLNNVGMNRECTPTSTDPC